MWLTFLFIFAGTAMGIFVGLYACSLLDLGFAFTDLRKDIAKCLVVSAVMSGALVAGLLLGLFHRKAYLLGSVLEWGG